MAGDYLRYNHGISVWIPVTSDRCFAAWIKKLGRLRGRLRGESRERKRKPKETTRDLLERETPADRSRAFAPPLPPHFPSLLTPRPVREREEESWSFEGNAKRTRAFFPAYQWKPALDNLVTYFGFHKVLHDSRRAHERGYCTCVRTRAREWNIQSQNFCKKRCTARTF